MCSVCSLLSSVWCSCPPAAFSFSSSQLCLSLRRVAGSPVAPMVTPQLRLPSRLWSSSSPVPLLRLRWSLLPFFSASLVLARLFRSFPALFIGPLLRLPFAPSGPLLLLCVLRLPLFPWGSVWAFWHFPLSYCLILPRFLPSFALLLGLRSLSRSFHILIICWRFFGTSGSHQPVSFFPFVCYFSLSLWFLPRSDLRFPSGRVRFCSALRSSLFSEFPRVFLFLSVWFSCFPLTHSHLKFP